MGGQNFKNHMQVEMEKDIEKQIADISHPEEVEKVAEQLYMKWYEKNLLPFDYTDKDGFVEYFTNQYNLHMEKYIDNFLNQNEVR